ncbi:MAG: hypothetical protein Q8R72_14640 [Hylemonella sp.]|nr:hypothetical protein [Hylemonella sp.]
MAFEFEERQDRIDQLSKLLSVTQNLARKLGNESHGRSYDKVHELNEILHRARLQMEAIETEERRQVLMERRRAPRTSLDI